MHKIIVNLGPNGEMGFENALIAPNPLDLQLFKLITCTAGAPYVFAGRKTAESMPFALHGRTQFYVTTKPVQEAKVLPGGWMPIDYETCRVFHSGWVIGGAGLIKAMAPNCNEAYVSTDMRFPVGAPCDTFLDLKELGFKTEDAKRLFSYEGLSIHKVIK